MVVSGKGNRSLAGKPCSELSRNAQHSQVRHSPLSGVWSSARLSRFAGRDHLNWHLSGFPSCSPVIAISLKQHRAVTTRGLASLRFCPVNRGRVLHALPWDDAVPSAFVSRKEVISSSQEPSYLLENSGEKVLERSSNSLGHNTPLWDILAQRSSWTKNPWAFCDDVIAWYSIPKMPQIR